MIVLFYFFSHFFAGPLTTSTVHLPHVFIVPNFIFPFFSCFNFHLAIHLIVSCVSTNGSRIVTTMRCHGLALLCSNNETRHLTKVDGKKVPMDAKARKRSESGCETFAGEWNKGRKWLHAPNGKYQIFSKLIFFVVRRRVCHRSHIVCIYVWFCTVAWVPVASICHFTAFCNFVIEKMESRKKKKSRETQSMRHGTDCEHGVMHVLNILLRLMRLPNIHATILWKKEKRVTKSTSERPSDAQRTLLWIISLHRRDISGPPAGNGGSMKRLLSF